ncbi:endonuclease [Pseudomonas carnis]|jgi:deoxyribonuclease-1|uniref:endonuclease n=1 Tax=Pseudomonas carnis TaxID=2487355 RepID=UPI0018E7AA27|nr:endonuclease [Pseudomonas carnis]MBJ2215802.1 endonuclease [Pseudomonas carnis]
MFRKIALAAIPLALFLSAGLQAAPDNFSEAKRLLRTHVYNDQNNSDLGTLYCGCKWTWVGKSGGQIEQGSCNVNPAVMPERAARLEWEHQVPAAAFGQQRQCWRNGGRSNCEKTDPVFNRMEADMFNLAPSVGSVNAIRSNISYGMVTGPSLDLGSCPSKAGSLIKAFEPRDEVKGMVARTTFYMADRYSLSLSRQQQQLYMAWDKSYPVTPWETERDKRISRSMGHHNPFVTGQKQWGLGYRPSGEGLGPAGASEPVAAQRTQVNRDRETVPQVIAMAGVIYGNRNSRVYHLPQGCPSYSQISAKNRVEFESEAEAKGAGFRKAGNCE